MQKAANNFQKLF